MGREYNFGGGWGMSLMGRNEQIFGWWGGDIPPSRGNPDKVLFDRSADFE